MKAITKPSMKHATITGLFSMTGDTRKSKKRQEQDDGNVNADFASFAEAERKNILADGIIADEGYITAEINRRWKQVSTSPAKAKAKETKKAPSTLVSPSSKQTKEAPSTLVSPSSEQTKEGEDDDNYTEMTRRLPDAQAAKYNLKFVGKVADKYLYEKGEELADETTAEKVPQQVQKKKGWDPLVIATSNNGVQANAELPMGGGNDERAQAVLPKAKKDKQATGVKKIIDKKAKASIVDLADIYARQGAEFWEHVFAGRLLHKSEGSEKASGAIRVLLTEFGMPPVNNTRSEPLELSECFAFAKQLMYSTDDEDEDGNENGEGEGMDASDDEEEDEDGDAEVDDEEDEEAEEDGDAEVDDVAKEDDDAEVDDVAKEEDEVDDE